MDNCSCKVSHWWNTVIYLTSEKSPVSGFSHCKKTKIENGSLKKFRAVAKQLIRPKHLSDCKKSVWAWRKAWQTLLQRSACFEIRSNCCSKACTNWGEPSSSPGPINSRITNLVRTISDEILFLSFQCPRSRRHLDVINGSWILQGIYIIATIEESCKNELGIISIPGKLGDTSNNIGNGQRLWVSNSMLEINIIYSAFIRYKC